MAQTEVELCNEALLLIGQKEPIDTLSDATAAGQACNAFYADVRDETLEAAPWPFARRHALLALLSETRSGWQYVYAVPKDCIAPRYIFNGVRPGGPFTGYVSVPAGQLPAGYATMPPYLGGAGAPVSYSIEAAADGSGPVLLTDQTSAELVYTAQITAVAAFPPLFRRALKQLLASRLAAALPVKGQLVDFWQKQHDATVLKSLASQFRSEREDREADAAHIAVRG